MVVGREIRGLSLEAKIRQPEVGEGVEGDPFLCAMLVIDTIDAEGGPSAGRVERLGEKK